MHPRKDSWRQPQPLTVPRTQGCFTNGASANRKIRYDPHKTLRASGNCEDLVQWRIAVEIAGVWELSEEDRYDPTRAEHRQLRELSDEVLRVYGEKNLDLLDVSRTTRFGADCARQA